MWWHAPLVPATGAAEAQESLEHRRQRLQWAKIMPLHSSLGDEVRLSQKKRYCKKMKNIKDDLKGCIKDNVEMSFKMEAT